MNNPILPMEAKVIDLSYCDLDPSNNLIELPVAEEVGKMGVKAIKDAGLSFNLVCPLDGEYKIGDNWYDTH